MKKTVLSLAIAVIFGATATAKATTPADVEKNEVNAEKSTVSWKA